MREVWTWVCLIAAGAGCSREAEGVGAASATVSPSATVAPRATTAASAQVAPSTTVAAPAAVAASAGASDSRPFDASYAEWAEWNGFGPKCGFHVPTSVSELPRPPVWTRCPSSAEPAGCEALDVGTAHASMRVHARSDDDVQAMGRADLNLDGEELQLVFSIDLIRGRVRNALARRRSAHGCRLEAEAVDRRTAVAEIMGDEPGDVIDDTGFIPPGAFIAWQGESLAPQMIESWGAGIVMPEVALGATAWGRASRSGVFLRAWGSAPGTFLLDHPTTEPHALLLHGEGALWIDGGGDHPLMVWTKGGTPVALSGLDGAFGLGGDGTDLAWLHRDADGSRCTLMTSRASLDPGAIDARAVVDVTCDVSSTWLQERWIVGCGHASHTDRYAFDGTWSIRRLRDGQRWQTKHQVVGITCQHVYVVPRGVAGGHPLYRLAWSSLGPGEPAPPAVAPSSSAGPAPAPPASAPPAP